MKKYFSLIILLAITTLTHAQGLKGLVNKVLKKDSTTGLSAGLSVNEIAAGLKEALETGAEKSASKLSAVDGFFGNAALKILMPAEAKKVEQKLRAFGFGKQVDNAILSMNRAAEDAAKSAAPIFVQSIRQMTIQDAAGILRGGDFAATDYLKSKTTTALTAAFTPAIEKALAATNATKYWNTLFTTYNRLSKEPVNPDLTAYVTERSLSGIFTQLAAEEQQIRKNPAARTSELLKKVFGK